MKSNKNQTCSKKYKLKVFRSNLHFYAQVLDNLNGNTIASASSLKSSHKGISASKFCAKSLAEKLSKIEVTSLFFDRGNYLYKGKIKAFIEELRLNNIKV